MIDRTTPSRPRSRKPRGAAIASKASLEFELDFLGRVLERDPLYGDALKVHADNLAAKGYYNRALQADLQLVRLRPRPADPLVQPGL